MTMKILHRRCAALDVHKETVVACVRTIQGRRVEYETETFGTTTALPACQARSARLDVSTSSGMFR